MLEPFIIDAEQTRLLERQLQEEEGRRLFKEDSDQYTESPTDPKEDPPPEIIVRI